jgi:hypothetical protein
MQSFSNLLKGKSQITYQDLLSTNEWFDKRNAIIKRDNKRCTICNLSPTGNSVHYDEIKKEYSYITDDGSEYTQYIKNNEELIIEESVPRIIITNKSYHLQVHHKYYISNKLPWDYNDTALITVCNWCHTNIHKNESILMYKNENLNDFEELISCGRCDGSGYIPEYSHVQGGVCFECHGKRFKQLLFEIK